jgi:UDP-N-acetylglucosamine 2-epimerase (non-hydrolysing)
MHIIHVVGARPNFMKAAPVIRALQRRDHRQTLVHTGQHYDSKMSQVFFAQLGMGEPDVNLGVGSASHARQTAQIMVQFEPVVMESRPDLVLIYGDVNSTMAAALVCSKLLIPVGHVEAGLRSFDRTMPEEINRLVTDQVADLLFTHSEDANENLRREGIESGKVWFVGNVMIDSLRRLLPLAVEPAQARKLGLWGNYGLVTLHRPSNVDHPSHLQQIMSALNQISLDLPLLFPLHPRTRKCIEGLGWKPSAGLHLLQPLSYLEFLALQRRATLVITDSGGVQEETTFLGVPCLTVRENTERPVTLTLGTNRLVGQNMTRLRTAVENILNGHHRRVRIPHLWDGKVAERIAQVIDEEPARQPGLAAGCQSLGGNGSKVQPSTPKRAM